MIGTNMMRNPQATWTEAPFGLQSGLITLLGHRNVYDHSPSAIPTRPQNSLVLALVHRRIIMPGLTTSPPFPDNVPTHPLLVVDYSLLKAGDEAEKAKLWKAATELGFW